MGRGRLIWSRGRRSPPRCLPAAGPARAQPSAKSLHPLCEGTCSACVTQYCSAALEGAVAGGGGRSLLPCPHYLIYSSNHPLRVMLSSPHFEVRASASGHMFSICTPTSDCWTRAPLGVRRVSRASAESMVRGWGWGEQGAAARRLSHLSPPPGPSVPSTGHGTERTSLEMCRW